jgi:hypothetical protein
MGVIAASKLKKLLEEPALDVIKTDVDPIQP